MFSQKKVDFQKAEVAKLSEYRILRAFAEILYLTWVVVLVVAICRTISWQNPQFI